MAEATPAAPVEVTTTPAATTPTATTPAAAPAPAKTDSTQEGTALTGGAKTGGEEPPVKPPEAKPVVPEKYELKLPEGSLLDAAQVDKIAAFAKASGLSNDQAQVILERESDAVSSFSASQQQAFDKAQAQWSESLKSDPDIGGDALPKSVELAKRVVERFGSEALKKQLNDTRLGNHPELVRVFVKIGRAMSEDQLIIPGSSSGGDNKKSMEDILYGKPNEMGK